MGKKEYKENVGKTKIKKKARSERKNGMNRRLDRGK